MLKVKDNVDLKELEKYGYRQDVDMSFSYHKNLYLSGVEIFIDSGTRQIHELYHPEYKCEFENLKYIDDLIKDGLVEKVSDK